MQDSATQEHAFEVLCCLAHSKQEYLDHARINSLMGQRMEWSLVLQLAELHKIRPLVQNTLINICGPEIPSDSLESLVELDQSSALHNLFLTKELGRLLSVLDANQINALTLKGPALAHVAYGDLNLRSYLDMDVLIEGKRYEEVRGLLFEDGYQVHPRLRGFNRMQEKMYVVQHAQYPFTKGALTYRLDLHTRVMPHLLQYNMHFGTLWERSREISVAGTSMRTFETEDMLLVLCFHGVKNRWNVLKYICDVAELIRSTPDLDWDLVVQRAHHMQSLRVLLLGLRLTKTLLNTPLPSEINHMLSKSEDLDEVIELLLLKLSQRKLKGVMTFAERFHFYMTIQDTFTAKLRYVAHAFLRRIDSVLLNTEVA